MDRRRERSLWRSVPVMLACILAGALFIEPSVAHVTRRVTHLINHLNPVFVNVGEAAGGSLTGNYPNPGVAINAIGSAQLADNSVGGSEVANESLTTSDIDENSLGQVPNADTLDALDASEFITVARSSSLTGGFGTVCDPSSTTYIDCLSVPLNLPSNGRVLVIATSQWDDGTTVTQPASGACRLRIDDATVIGPPDVDVGQSTATHTGTSSPGSWATTAVSGVLSAGPHFADLECKQSFGDIVFWESSISAVLLSDA